MLYILAFLIPAIMYVVTLFFTNTFPFGDNALLISDISNQFASFYTYFRHVILSEDNVIYTFSKTLGGDMTGFAGYYLNNPFLFLLLPFKNEYIPAGIVFITGLQLSLMGLTMAVFLKDLAGDRDVHPLLIVMCSSAYAFSGYNLAYLTLPIYFCDLILFPLVMLGIRRLLQGRYSLYVITLALSIILNYYIGYMICIFSVLYFIYNLAVYHRLKERVLYRDFALSSVIAGGLSAFSLLPTVLSLRGQKNAPQLSALTPHISYGIRTLLRHFFVGAFNGDLSNYSGPYIYIGEVLLIGIVIFFISKRTGLRKKIWAASLLLVLFLSTYISTFDIIWHGFNAPVGFAHRYAFIICTVTIAFAFEGYMHVCEAWVKSSLKKISIYVLAAAEIITLTANSVLTLNVHENRSFSEYRAYYEHVDRCISRIKGEDPELYRIEKDFERNHTDSMLFAYNGIAHNSSCERDYVKRFAADMGFRYFEPIWTAYNSGSTAFADCFLGIRYLISEMDHTNKPYLLQFESEGKNARGDDRTAYVYKNPYALPLCFTMTGEELDTDMDDPDLFRIQNGIAGSGIYKRVGEPVKDVTFDDELTLSVTAPTDGNLYFYATAPDYQGTRIYINDEPFDDYFSHSRWNILNIGSFDAGQSVDIRLEATDGNVTVDEVFIYSEDTEELKRWYHQKEADKGELDKITSSRLSGHINNEEGEKIVFSIPYETAWKIRIDERKTQPEEALGALLSVEAPPGYHTIEMTYVPDGLIPGIIISLITLAACLGLTFYRRTIMMVKVRNEEDHELGR